MGEYKQNMLNVSFGFYYSEIEQFTLKTKLVQYQHRYQKSHRFFGKDRIISVLEKFKPPIILAKMQLKIGGPELS